MKNSINDFFNASKDVKTEWGNKYTIKVQSTVRPSKKYTYNEVHQNINKQLKPKTK